MIDRNDFARDCADHAFRFGVNSHYLVAVAELLSGIKDDSEGDRIGPFRVKQADWDAQGSDPTFELDLQPAEINRPGLQCAFAALQTLRAQKKFLQQNDGKFPNPDQLYALWPNQPPPAGKTLQGALDSTKDSAESAEKAALEGLDLGMLAGDIKLDSIKPEKQPIALQIIEAFKAAGFGKLQQVAAVANAIAESNLNPNAHAGGGEDSWGLFQLNRNGGLGTGHQPEELVKPERNIAIIISEADKFPAFKAAPTLQEAVSVFVHKIERPADQAGETIKRTAIASKLLPA